MRFLTNSCKIFVPLTGYVKERINTVGRARIVNREKGVTESNEEIKRELREDLRARRLAKAMLSDADILAKASGERRRAQMVNMRLQIFLY